VGLLGARKEVLGAVERRLRERGVHIVFARDGYFGAEQEEALASQIHEAAPQLLLVAMGSPRTERFVARWGERMAVPLVMGVGGTFDVLAGAVRRAPDWVARHHLEWAWRFLGSPRARWERAVLDSARFVAAIASGRRLP
jgi:N-acetylglucosaminyldiphosphoundecaprenol N-acetyl-beta-D-mannosaminyltransferase